MSDSKNNKIFWAIFIAFAVLVVLGVGVFFYTQMNNSKTDNSGKSKVALQTPSKDYSIEVSPVPILPKMEKTIDSFNKSINDSKNISSPQPNEPLKYVETRVYKDKSKRLVYQDKNYKYIISDNGNVIIEQKDIKKTQEIIKSTSSPQPLPWYENIAMKASEKLATVSKGCSYVPITQVWKTVKGYFITINERSNKNSYGFKALTGTRFIYVMGRAGEILNAGYYKGDKGALKVATETAAKISPNQAKLMTTQFVSTTYKKNNLSIGKITNLELLVYNSKNGFKLTWEVDFLLKLKDGGNGNYTYRQKMDAITGEVLVDAIATLRNTIKKPISSPNP
ncbi:MAG: hypothetical protein WCQ41_07230 [Bacillota bacterium]